MVRMFALVVTAASLSACATTGATPAPFPRPGGSPPTVATPAPTPVPAPAPPADSPAPPTVPLSGSAASVTNSTGYALAGIALSLRGLPYRTGGSDPKGFDCSGLVHYVFAQYGVSVPRTVAEQFHAGHEVAADEVQPGDLVFFATVSSRASHVGIAIGGDEFVDAPSGSGEVRVEHLSSSYWRSRFVGARRIL